MIKKSITFTDFNDNEVTEVHHFHLSKAELVEWEHSIKGGFGAHLERIVKSEDTTQLIPEFKDLVLRCYGKKSEDGRQFIKNDALRTEFSQTAAYSALFMELATDPKKAAEFVNGIVPRDMSEGSAEAMKNVFEDGPPVQAPPAPSGPGTPVPGFDPSDTADAQEDQTLDEGPRILTKAEVAEMDSGELTGLLTTGRAVIGDA